MGKQLTSADYKKKFTELRAKQRRLNQDVADRLFALCQAYPNVVLRKYPCVDIYASVIRTQTNADMVEIDKALEYIATIEKHIARNNPRKQLELDLKDQK